MMESREPLVSPDVLARYAGDAASEVDGVSALAESSLHRGGAVVVTRAEDALEIAVHVELEWGTSATDVGDAVQSRVREYVEKMANAKVGTVDVVVERVGPSRAAR
jgi:uncharacterized alkaline shock family protein YloU